MEVKLSFYALGLVLQGENFETGFTGFAKSWFLEERFLEVTESQALAYYRQENFSHTNILSRKLERIAAHSLGPLYVTHIRYSATRTTPYRYLDNQEFVPVCTRGDAVMIGMVVTAPTKDGEDTFSTTFVWPGFIDASDIGSFIGNFMENLKIELKSSSVTWLT